MGCESSRDKYKNELKALSGNALDDRAIEKIIISTCCKIMLLILS
jgi:hypothetical protein